MMFLESFGSATYTKGHFLSIPKAHDNDGGEVEYY